MKLLLASALIVLSFLIAASYSMTTQCSSFQNEQGCENAGCSWCDRCSGKEINNYGWDRCVDSNLQCTYSCSKTCGANCATDSECAVNLTDTTCFYGGKCGTCKCSYLNVTCQKNATVTDQYGDKLCYYGARSCTSGGCSVNSCALSAGRICDPSYGCIPCQDNCTGSEFVIDKKCSGSDVTGSVIRYVCSGGQCNVTKSDYVEKCKNGCFNNACREEKCNINGVQTDCSKFDGFYGNAYCKGDDIYKEYRDYGCGSNECIYASSEVLQERCGNETTPSASSLSCQNGRCYESGTVVNFTNGNAGQNSGNTSLTPSQSLQTSASQRPSFISGGRVYNGFFFGQNSINAKLAGSGKAEIKILRGNGAGTLTIEDKGKIIFTTRNAGNYSLSFENSDLKIYTTSSGWLFFMPAVYDLGNIEIEYR